VAASSGQVGGPAALPAKKSSSPEASAVPAGGAQAADPTDSAAADTRETGTDQRLANEDAASLPFTGFVLLPLLGVGVLALLAGIALRIRV
jgi:hypothetical protein